MKPLIGLLKKLQLRKILTVFVASTLLFLGTACNSGDVRGARPNNPPVQAGGANNPYKNGGDGYTQYNQSTDPRVNNNKRAELPLNSQLIALSRADGLLYGGESSKPSEQMPKNSNQPQPGGLIQREENIGDRVSDRLETVKEAVEEASSFLGDKAAEAKQDNASFNAAIKGSDEAEAFRKNNNPYHATERR